MDIWEKMYEEAQKLYNPHEVSGFVYANHVVAAVEAEAVSYTHLTLPTIYSV